MIKPAEKAAAVIVVTIAGFVLAISGVCQSCGTVPIRDMFVYLACWQEQLNDYRYLTCVYLYHHY